MSEVALREQEERENPQPLAEAMVRANLPEWCGQKITTMAQLDDAVAV